MQQLTAKLSVATEEKGNLILNKIKRVLSEMVSFTLSFTHAHKYRDVWPNSLSIITLGDAENEGQQLFNKSQYLSSFLDQSSCAGFGCAFCIRS